MSIPQNKIIKEACVETLEQAIAAEKKGAHRIELCGRLDLGGITPDYELIRTCLQNLNIPIKVMIRPRGGNFIYTEEEYQSMLSDIEVCKKLGVEEYVFGILKNDNSIDIDRMMSLSANVDNAPVTFHKAIDELSDFKFAIEQLKKIPQVKYILTSGLASTAMEGKDVLIQMIDLAKSDIQIVVAGKVTNENIDALHAIVNAHEYHGRLIVGKL